ncbi:MAG TPA: energy-coupling factor transporter transmembrane component T [Bacillota bacterium]
MINYLGKYYPENSFWHNADPRSKLTLTIVIILSLTVLKPSGLFIPVVIVAGLYLTARVPLRMGWLVIVRFKWLLLITLLVNFWGNGPGNGGILIIGNLIKLGITILIAAWLNYVTKPLSLIDGLAKWLQPLTVFRLPVADLALAAGLVFSFIPVLWDQAEQVLVAQKLRGAAPGKAWWQNQAWLRSTLIPIFIRAIRKAAAVAFAMEARGYRSGRNRTPWIELKFGAGDWLVVAIAIIYLICVTVLI